MLDAAEFHERFAGAIRFDTPPPLARAQPAFAVYRNTWIKGLLDALDANYPTVATILGPDLFKALAIQFAREYPSATPVLALYGAQFPNLLATHQVGREIPYLRDVANLERLWTECFFAPDAQALDRSDCAALEPDELLAMHLRLHPAARIALFGTPAVTIWQAHRAEGAFEEIEPEWKPERVLVTRRGSSVSVTLVDEPTYALLLEIRRGWTLGSAIASAAGAYPDSDLAQAMMVIISSAALTGRGDKERG